MPIALVPDGFSLKKVTKLQLEAIKDYRRHEDVKAFLSSSGSGKGLGLGAIGIILMIILPFMILAFIRNYSKDNPTQTFGEFAGELDVEGQPVTSTFALWGKAMAGILETLQNVILPEPLRDEIKAKTGLDVDVANVFEPLFTSFTDLQQQRKEQREAK
jgi:hypothetical protein